MFKISIPPIRLIPVFGLVILSSGCSTAPPPLNLGVQLERKGDYEAAAKAYTRAIEMEPGNALAFFNRGCAYRKLGDLESAEADFSRALELRPDLAAASMGRAQVRFSQRDYEGAIDDFTRTIELEPEHGDAYLGRGIASGLTGDDDLAMADFDKAVVIDPLSARGFMNRANLRAQLGDFQAALGDYDRAIELDPSSALARYNSGIAREQTGDFRGAMRDYEYAAGLSPEFAAKARRRLAVCASRIPGAAVPLAPGADPAAMKPADPFLEWETASLENGGEATEPVSRILARAARMRGLSSLIIVRRGRLLAEAYFDGLGRQQLRPVRSVTKSVLSLLVGIALREKILRGLDQPLADFFETVPESDSGTWGQVTFRELIALGAGLDWIEKAEWAYQGDAARAFEPEPEIETDGWARSLEDIPELEIYVDVALFTLLRNGGVRRDTAFISNSGAADLLSLALSRASGLSAMAFADCHLFQPLGIAKRRWGKTGPGTSHGSAGLFLRPLDMAKLGQLVVQGGVLGGREIIPPGWIEESLKVRQKTRGGKYGYLWRMETWDSRTVAMATGLGGQGIICLPERDIVIVTTGSIGPQDTPQVLKSQTDEIFGFVRRAVVPELLKSEKKRG